VLILSSEDERFSGWRYETWYGKGKRQSRGRIGAGRVFVRVVMGVGYGRRHREDVKGGTRRQGKHNFVKDTLIDSLVESCKLASLRIASSFLQGGGLGILHHKAPGMGKLDFPAVKSQHDARSLTDRSLPHFSLALTMTWVLDRIKMP